MFSDESNPQNGGGIEPSWQPIGSVERRVLGVLVEKAKTTPDAYPLTVNAITTGSNQKSNRSPLMQLDSIDVENALDRLRQLGAVSEVIGNGRTAKYRHRFYEWMGVEKLEAAVMAELLLRGEQTIGELRGRAARMGKIGSVAELRPLLQSLMEKGLVQALTPAGRGQMVTHCLYLPEQQDKLARTHGLDPDATGKISIGDSVEGDSCDETTTLDRSSQHPVAVQSSSNVDSSTVQSLQEEIQSLRELITEKVLAMEKRIENLEQLLN